MPALMLASPPASGRGGGGEPEALVSLSWPWMTPVKSLTEA